MVRFFCIDCDKVRRARTFPSSVRNTSAESPINRIGKCYAHQARITISESVRSFRPTSKPKTIKVKVASTSKGRK